MREFLKDCPAPADKKYAIVMDNTPWHKKMYRLTVTENNDEYSDIRDKVVFVLLPAIFTRLESYRTENTRNVFFDSIDPLESTVDNAFARWRTPNNQPQKKE